MMCRVQEIQTTLICGVSLSKTFRNKFDFDLSFLLEIHIELDEIPPKWLIVQKNMGQGIRYM
jgi:hypothetical protein